MTQITIHNHYTYDNLNNLKRVYNPSWELKEVRIVYNQSLGLPSFDSEPEAWPFRAIFTDGSEEIYLYIYCLTAGYGGTGPHNLTEILDFLKVPYEKDDIYTERARGSDGYIRLTYTF